CSGFVRHPLASTATGPPANPSAHRSSYSISSGIFAVMTRWLVVLTRPHTQGWPRRGRVTKMRGPAGWGGNRGAVNATQPNIVVFFWDNLGWGEVGCYGGGVLRGAPTPRIDRLAAEGLRLLNFNVEAQCTPSRSALLTGRHPIRSGTHSVPITGGPD